MWIISAYLLSFNYPNLSGALFGLLVGGFIVHFISKWAWKKGEDIYDLLWGEEK